MMHPCWVCPEYATDECKTCNWAEDYEQLFADDEKPDEHAKRAYRFMTEQITQEQA